MTDKAKVWLPIGAFLIVAVVLGIKISRPNADPMPMSDTIERTYLINEGVRAQWNGKPV